MCGIAGFFLQKNAFEKAKKAVFEIRERGTDGFGFSNGKQIFFGKEIEKISGLKGKNCIGHCLHSIVGFVPEPLKGKGLLAANSEIYNWKELNRKYSLNARNDSELLLKLIEKNGVEKIIETLEELDGTFAFAYWIGNKIMIARDLLGVKPLHYSLEKGFAFASEKKALQAAGLAKTIDLNPRQILVFDLETKKEKTLKRKFFDAKETRISADKAKQKFLGLLEAGVCKRIPGKKLGLLFSGGVDSTVIALMLKKCNARFKCYFAFVQGAELGIPRDLEFAKKIAEKHSLEFEAVPVSMGETEKLVKKIVPMIESANPIKVAVALPVFVACRKARQEKVKVIFSGLGSDEIFGGYARFARSNDISKDSNNLLLQMHENDLYRDDIVSMHNSIELRLPFLDKALVAFALQLPQKLKIFGNENKLVLRKAALELGLEKEFAFRKKTSAQYGSNFDKAIEKIARRRGFKRKTDFLNSIARKKNLRLGTLFSSGKDSCLALWKMMQQNYEISCLVSILPKNPDSFMFHKPSKKILELQSEASEIPLVIAHTKGEKESELIDLKKAIAKAKEKFLLDGIVAGAVYSNYQRERIQGICEELNLKLFSPVWHWKQSDVLKSLVKEKFEFVFCKIAAKGLGKEWLGKKIGKKEVFELIALEKKLGFNVAGEGGEFESIVLDAPFFKKKIVIALAMPRMRNDFSGKIGIKKAFLMPK